MEHTGSAIIHPKEYIRKDETITATDPNVSAKMCRKTPCMIWEFFPCITLLLSVWLWPWSSSWVLVRSKWELLEWECPPWKALKCFNHMEQCPSNIFITIPQRNDFPVNLRDCENDCGYCGCVLRVNGHVQFRHESVRGRVGMRIYLLGWPQVQGRKLAEACHAWFPVVPSVFLLLPRTRRSRWRAKIGHWQIPQWLQLLRSHKRTVH